MKTFTLFSKFFGLKANLLKHKVAGIGSLKEFKIECIKYIDLTTETTKILDVHLF